MYTASGTLPAAALTVDNHAIVEHGLYWAALDTQTEAYYLLAFLNSEAARQRIEKMQARGQWGARHFDKVMLSLQFPAFDQGNPLHQDLSALAHRAEQVAATVDIAGRKFVRARGIIRVALREDGVAGEMDRLVASILGGEA